ncbi:DUF922 domain-containing protein [Pontibacter sp. JH31]|uniref:DUF922 domain-containing protein n=1 Tax=Pontibacter aquaedesilientis TaxID=2766980 RepID=A0ABR7XG05_9BACT|nr:DUF922 domain-containing protein [Pontibacter aquaedesilientis]MBD1396311.1 DUF922 domain-containing protein [Pontibacter aquaedesilientis]
MFSLTLLLSLLLGLLMPAPTAAGLSPIASSIPVPTSAYSKDRIAWSETRKLNWEDFQASPEDGNPHHALTAANLAVDARCKDNKFYYEVKCVFLPGESWSKNKHSERLLAHEQLHFDLTEVHARQLRKKLRGIGNSCELMKTQLNTLVGAAFKEWKAEQEQFDKISRHGLDTDVQTEWADTITQRLAALEAYK